MTNFRHRSGNRCDRRQMPMRRLLVDFTIAPPIQRIIQGHEFLDYGSDNQLREDIRAIAQIAAWARRGGIQREGQDWSAQFRNVVSG